MADTVAVLGRSASSWNGFLVDATLQEEAEHTYDVTEHPVEDGSSIVDHVIRRPVSVTLTQAVSDHPGDGQDRVGRAREAYDKLVSLADLMQPADLVTGMRVYPNMVCASIRQTRTPQTRGTFAFTASFKQIRYATALVTTIPPSAPKPGTAQARTPPTANVGPQTPIAADAGTEAAVNSSIIASAFDAAAPYWPF